MKQIFHPYHLWEDHKHDFYNNCTGEIKKELLLKVVKMFSSQKKTRKYMERVVFEWANSMEHNLSNPTINQIAYIGQSAACLYCGAPNTVTMEAWWLVTKENRDKADRIALEILTKWKNKTTQLCLNIN